MVIIGEKLNSSIPKVNEAISHQDEAFVRDLAKSQEQAGAKYLDINAGMFVGEELKYLRWLMQAVRNTSSLPLVIDTPDPSVARELLPGYTGEKPILNSITLEESRYQPMLELALQYKTGLIALCMNDEGFPEGAERRIELALELVEKLTSAGVNRGDIYLDPMVRPIGSGEGYGMEALDAIRGIRAALPDVHIVCGMSNVSYGLPKRALINRTFLVAAMAAGLDAAIMDPLNRELMASLYAADALLGNDEYCVEYLGAFRDGLMG